MTLILDVSNGRYNNHTINQWTTIVTTGIRYEGRQNNLWEERYGE